MISCDLPLGTLEQILLNASILVLSMTFTLRLLYKTKEVTLVLGLRPKSYFVKVFLVTLIAFSSSKSSSTKGDVLEGGGVSSNVTLSDSSIHVTPGSVLVTLGSVVVTPGSVVTTGSVVTPVTPGSVVVTPGSVVVTTGSVVVTTVSVVVGSVVVTTGSVVVTTGSVVVTPGSYSYFLSLTRLE
ncbi:hypothetical protein Tco_0968577 [Tanacetum coccineum]